MLRFNPFRYTTFRTIPSLVDTFRTRTAASTVPVRLHTTQHPTFGTNQQSAIVRSIPKEPRVGFYRTFHDTSYKKQASDILGSVPVGEAEKMFDTRIDKLSGPVQEMLEDMPKASSDMKERVYAHLLDFLEFQGYPATEGGSSYRAAQTSDLVLYTIGPLLSDFRRSTGRNIRLERQHDVLSFVVIDGRSVTEEKFVLVIEGNRSSFEESMKMCLLSLKYAVGKNWRDDRNIGKVYGFVTTGESWQMVSYDGQDYCISRKMNLLFRGMDKDKEEWLKHHSCVVDCLYAALSQGGCDDAYDSTIEGC